MDKRTQYIPTMFAMLIALCQLSCVSAAKEGDQLGIASIIEAHKSSRALIESFSCKVDYSVKFVDGNGKAVVQSCSGQTWMSRDGLRSKIREDGKVLDYLWKDSVREAIVAQGEGQGKKQIAASRASFPTPHIHRCDAWNRGLLAIVAPSDFCGYPLERLVSKSAGHPIIERFKSGEREVYSMTLSFPASKSEDRTSNWKLQLQIDPAVNYLISKAIYTAVDNNYQRIEEVVKFKECRPGIYFPEKIASTDSVSGKLGATSETIISDININYKLPNDIFRFKYPNGIYLTDSIKKTSYKIDEDGNPLTKEVPLSMIPPAPAGKSDAVVPMTETKEEPASSTRWIIPVSLGLIIVAIVLLIRRRIQSKSP